MRKGQAGNAGGFRGVDGRISLRVSIGGKGGGVRKEVYEKGYVEM